MAQRTARDGEQRAEGRWFLWLLVVLGAVLLVDTLHLLHDDSAGENTGGQKTDVLGRVITRDSLPAIVPAPAEAPPSVVMQTTSTTRLALVTTSAVVPTTRARLTTTTTTGPTTTTTTTPEEATTAIPPADPPTSVVPGP